jgi:hypothetical protein
MSRAPCGIPIEAASIRSTADTLGDGTTRTTALTAMTTMVTESDAIEDPLKAEGAGGSLGTAAAVRQSASAR